MFALQISMMQRKWCPISKPGVHVLVLCSRTPAAQRAAKQSPITIGTESNACIEIGNLSTLFAWSAWLVAWSQVHVPYNNNDIARHGSHIPANRLTEAMQPWFTAYIFDVFDMLYIHVMVNRQLSKQGIHWPVSHDHTMGSGLELTKCWFLDWIAGSCQVNFFC